MAIFILLGMIETSTAICSGNDSTIVPERDDTAVSSRSISAPALLKTSGSSVQLASEENRPRRCVSQECISSEWDLDGYFGKFQHCEYIERGLFGKVYLFYNDGETKYAVKKIRKMQDMDGDWIRTIVMKQSNILKTLKSPFIAELYEVLEDNYFFYMAMEYVGGGDLLNFVENTSRQMIPEDIARFIVAEIIVVLEYIHGEGYVHGDLKPENIVIGLDGHIRLVDFDFMGRIGETSDNADGTLGYMAPEVFENPPYSKERDYFSLGAILYMMLTGRHAFPETETHSQMHKCVCETSPTLPAYFSLGARDIVGRLLTKDPAERLRNIDTGALKAHIFFGGIDWTKLKNRRYRSPIRFNRQPQY